VRDPEVHRAVLRGILAFAAGQDLALRGLMASPVAGPKGNVEFLAWFGLEGGGLEQMAAIAAALDEAQARAQGYE
jgi:23S rRNA (cytidine1920-2'-O)/16S rRNA (cytidine1409-2'-O)-methyltransferase